MTLPEDVGLSRAEIELIAEALAVDPALARELTTIDAELEAGRRGRFWAALAAGLPARRPASAVLAALEVAAVRQRSRGDQSS